MEQMKSRLSQLNALFALHTLSLREAGERDAILNHGLLAWENWKLKHRRRR